MTETTVQKLAAYATIKGMTDSKKYKNQYYILAEFIKFVISKFNLFSFSVIEIVEKLKEEFDFEIPYAVVKSSLKKIDGLRRESDEYTVETMNAVSQDFQETNETDKNECLKLIESLEAYISLESDKAFFTDPVEMDFLKYILDRREKNESKYSNLFSKFFLSIENNADLQNAIERIREGSVLYCGLCYNLIDVGSITEDLCLYLDTEVLFFLMGYNGSLSQRIVEDLMSQIRAANRNGTKISLAYFSDVQNEIDRYFNAAKNIVAGRGGVVTSRAMASIVNGCEHESDVLDRQSDFYYRLEKQYGIRLDSHEGVYYQKENHQFNIEELEDDEKTQEAMKFVSHIHVLRRGNEYTDYTKSRFLIVTETRRLQEVSDRVRSEGKCGYALPVGKITNILWVKLGGAFGKRVFPCNANIAVKARMVLGNSIATNVNRVFAQVFEEYKENKLNEDQAVARVMRLQELLRESENIDSSNVGELTDFSEESIHKYEDAVRLGAVEIKKRDDIISQLTNEKKRNTLEIDRIQQISTDKDVIIKEQNKKIQRYEEEALKRESRKSKCELWFSRISGSMFFVLSVILGSRLVNYFSNEGHRNIWKSVIDVVGSYASICTLFPEANLFSKWKEKHALQEKRKNYRTKGIVYSALCALVIIIYIFIPRFVGEKQSEAERSVQAVEMIMLMEQNSE